MNIYEMVARSRSYRRFYENYKVSMETLTSLVDLSRLTPSAANLQPLRYIISNDPVTNGSIFETLTWAAYLKDWPGPSEGERPSAYIVILGEKKHSKTAAWDMGIAAQTIMLGATEAGLGGCIVGSIKKEALSEALQVPDELEVLLVLALGKPKEMVLLETLKPGQDIKYWRDSRKVHHVPKRPLEEVLIKSFERQEEQ
ncbi:nitroreductase [Desulfonatronospira thiodismutans ASO3-1]|uniref:Nitroreductase n=1 Tax=Desulfonatronospira thiodismutans ASO3-1 TaxID=555779 RepID=D6SRJ3_9BACT|nr:MULTISPECIES: nitroreductase family protein [Desulfonatronospira]EFI33309.1 nitroreductase [Desulfonatronospira thiodismutans ASO3-1]RQD73504.1 MAG: nitroreductase [Desulfonatronospira sp. MSAO_Bac3]